MSIQEKSPFYENRKLTLTDNGDILLEQDNIRSEALQRLYSLADSWVFDDRGDHGSELFGAINIKRSQLSHNLIRSWIREALTPMVNQGMIRPNMDIYPYLTNYALSVDLTIYNIEGKPIAAVFRSFLLN